MIPSLHTRVRDPEQMDLPDCDEPQLLRTLDQFASVNRLFSRVRPLLHRTVLRDMHRTPSIPRKLVDLGAGGCDIPVWLLRQARRQGLSLTITAVDADPRVVQHARNRLATEPGLEIRQADALHPESFAPFDYLFANHFLHHLPDPDIPPLLQSTTRLASRGVVFSDLRRSRASYLAFSLAALPYRRSFTRQDGLLSIRKAFTPRELRQYAQDTNLQLHTALPGRLILTNLLGK